MRKLPALLLLILSFCLCVIAQGNEASLCPKIEVTGPSSTAHSGGEVVFTVMVSGADENKLKYQWSVSAGKIEDGQGTPVIHVGTTGLKTSQLKANVKIDGLPDKCETTQNITAEICYCCGDPPALEDYGKLTLAAEKKRISAALMEFKYGGNIGLFFLISHAKNTNFVMLKSRLLNIEKFLNKTHHIPKERIYFIVAGENILKTKIYVFPDCASMGNNNWKEAFDKLIVSSKKANKTKLKK